MFLITILIVVLAAFFASTNPDGLDFISEKLGFSSKGIQQNAPLAGYKLAFFPNGGFSTFLAGLAGVLIILVLFCLTIYLLKKDNNKSNKVACFLLFSIFAAMPVFAARPLFTDDFSTVPQGAHELEVGYYSTQYQVLLSNYVNFIIKRGFLPNFDFGVEIPYTTSYPAGLNDIYLHAKYRFWKVGENEGATFRINYKFNNGNVLRGLGSGDSDYWLALIYSKMLGRTKTHLNVGYVNVGIHAGLPLDDYLFCSFALEHPVWGEKGEVVAEYVANNTIVPNPSFIQLGARYLIANGLKLDAGYSFGWNDNSIKNNVTAGLHWEF